MPRRRKSKKYAPLIDVLLRDAQPTRREIEGEKNARNRRARIAARDQAIDALVKMYWAAEKRGTIDRLDFRVRVFCEQLKARSGRLPRPRGGRPIDVRHRFLIAVEVQEEIEADAKKHGSVDRALRKVSERHRVSYKYVRDTRYGRGARFRSIPVKTWRLAVKAEVARRKFEAEPEG